MGKPITKIRQAINLMTLWVLWLLIRGCQTSTQDVINLEATEYTLAYLETGSPNILELWEPSGSKQDEGCKQCMLILCLKLILSCLLN